MTERFKTMMLFWALALSAIATIGMLINTHRVTVIQEQLRWMVQQRQQWILNLKRDNPQLVVPRFIEHD